MHAGIYEYYYNEFCLFLHNKWCSDVVSYHDVFYCFQQVYNTVVEKFSNFPVALVNDDIDDNDNIFHIGQSQAKINSIIFCIIYPINNR